MSERKARGERCDHGISIWLSCYECKVYDAKKISEELENLRAENERLKYEQENDYKGMREFQMKFIRSDQELTRVKSAAQKLVEALEEAYEGTSDVCMECSVGKRALAEWRKEMGDEQKESGDV